MTSSQPTQPPRRPRPGRWLACAAAMIAGAATAQWSHGTLAGEASARSSRSAKSASVGAPRLPGIGRGASALDPKTAVSTQTPTTRLSAELSPHTADGLARRFRKGRVITGAAKHRLILFSFDDGPDVRYTPELLDTLDRMGIKALFFLTAERIDPSNPWGRQHARIARDIVERGHLVGSHTVHHAQLPLLENEAVIDELEQGERIFERVFGGRPWLLRPPGGARSERVDRLVAERGYTQVMWNLGAEDGELGHPESVVDRWTDVLDRREREEGQRGGIILLHDIHEWTVRAVRGIVQELRRRNCRLLRRGKELYDIVDDPRLFFHPRGDAPAGTEAPPADPPAEILERRQARLRIETAQRCSHDDSRRVASTR